MSRRGRPPRRSRSRRTGGRALRSHGARCIRLRRAVGVFETAHRRVVELAAFHLPHECLDDPAGERGDGDGCGPPAELAAKVALIIRRWLDDQRRRRIRRPRGSEGLDVRRNGLDRRRRCGGLRFEVQANDYFVATAHDDFSLGGFSSGRDRGDAGTSLEHTHRRAQRQATHRLPVDHHLRPFRPLQPNATHVRVNIASAVSRMLRFSLASIQGESWRSSASPRWRSASTQRRNDDSASPRWAKARAEGLMALARSNSSRAPAWSPRRRCSTPLRMSVSASSPGEADAVPATTPATAKQMNRR